MGTVRAFCMGQISRFKRVLCFGGVLVLPNRKTR